MRFKIFTALAVACALFGGVATADGTTGTKRPLLTLADGTTGAKRPLLALADGTTGTKRPLLNVG